MPDLTPLPLEWVGRLALHQRSTSNGALGGDQGMAKRFIDTEIWEEDWFTEMPLKMQHFWIYICTKCDHAGVWKANFKSFERRTREIITKAEIAEHLGSRVAWLSDTRLWIKGFIGFQYGELSPKVASHRGVIAKLYECGRDVPLDLDALAIIKKFNDFKETSVSPTYPLPMGYVPPKDTDTDSINSSVLKEQQRTALKQRAPNQKVSAPPAASLDGLESCIGEWGTTLQHFGRSRDPRLDAIELGRLVTRYGAERVRYAIVGARFEQPTQTFDPRKHLSLERIGRPANFEKLVGLGDEAETRAAPKRKTYADEVV